MQIINVQPIAILKWLMLGVALCLTACGGGSSDTGTGTGTVVTDTTPNSFSFASQSNTPLNQWVQAAAITVSGINSASSISVSNGEYAINGAGFTTSPGVVNNGNTVVLRHRASADNAVTTTSTLTIGGVSASFSSTTVAASSGVAEAVINVNFPLGNAKTERNTLRVSGNAISPLPLTSITVNGVVATVSDANAVTPGKVTPATSPANNSVNWYADVPLPANTDSTVAVAITDAAGNSDSEAATVQISRKFAPSTFSFDAATNRLYALVENNELVSIDLQSLNYQFLSTAQGAAMVAFAADIAKVFYATVLDNTVTLYNTDGQTGVTSQTHRFTVPLAQGQFINLTDIVYSEAPQALYFMLAYPANDRANFLHELYSFKLETNTLTLVSSDTVGVGPRLETNKLLVMANQLLAFTWDRDGLISIDPNNGNRTALISGIPGFNMTLARGETDSVVYTAGFAGVFRIDLTTSEISNISPEAAQDTYVTAQIESLTFDQQRNRLLMSDSMAGLVLAVDIDSGSRSKVLSSGVGDGRYLLMPQNLAIDTENNIAYVLDANSNASQALLAIDLASADRSFVTASANLPNDVAVDLLLDSARNRLIAVYHNQIVAIDIASKAVSVLKSRGGESGIPVASFNGGVIDSVNNKLLLSSFLTDNTLVELDLLTNQHQLLAITPKDANSPVTGVVDITLNENADTVYLLSQSQGVIYQLNRSSGEAGVIVSACNNAANFNMLDPNYTTAQNIIYNPADNSLLATANAVLEVNLADNSCIAFGNNADSHIDLSLTGDNQLLTTQQNKLLQYDRANNQSVVISR